MAERLPVLVLDGDPAPLAAALAARFPVAPIPCATFDEVAPLVARHRPQVALTYRINTLPYPREALVNGSLRWIHAGGAGVDHLAPWDPARVTVTNSSGIHGDVIAEYVGAAILGVAHNFPAYARDQAAARWAPRQARTVAGQTVLVVGFGRIGEAVGALCRRLGMRVVGVRNAPFASPAADRGIGLADLADALPEADHVVVTLPLTAETRGLFDAALLARAKAGAHLVNVARGGIIDETALAEALDAGRLAHVTSDVFAREPLPGDSPLWTHPRATLTPHASANVADWRWRVLRVFEDNLARWLGGRPLVNVVRPERGY